MCLIRRSKILIKNVFGAHCISCNHFNFLKMSKERLEGLALLMTIGEYDSFFLGRYQVFYFTPVELRFKRGLDNLWMGSLMLNEIRENLLKRCYKILDNKGIFYNIRAKDLMLGRYYLEQYLQVLDLIYLFLLLE
jgi:hypothetical protein